MNISTHLIKTRAPLQCRKNNSSILLDSDKTGFTLPLGLGQLWQLETSSETFERKKLEAIPEG